MQLDSTTELLKGSSKRQKITISNDKLSALQWRRVLTFNLIPLLGCVVGIIQLWFGWVSRLDIWLLVTMYALMVVGITVGYHRHLAHKAFQTHTIVRVLLTILGSMAGQGPPIYWVANHRRHHQYSDQPGDPHSPHITGIQNLSGLRGLWHAHIGWLFDQEITNSLVFAKDLLRDPVISQVNRWYISWLLLGLILPAVLGGVMTNTLTGALSGFLWGGLVRMFFSIQSGYLINSITHYYGNRPFDTREKSTNNIWLAIPTGGEAWHNNHHAFPNSAKFGLQWWQLDLGYWVIRALEFTGLIWEVKKPNAGMIKAKMDARDA